MHSLSTNVELITAIANDLGYENVFAYQLQSQSEPGDVLIAVSSSGRSPNIIHALTWARDHGLGTIAITGFDGGVARTIADVSIHVESTNYGVIEDLHQADHALPGPVHPPLANEPGRYLGERVLSFGAPLVFGLGALVLFSESQTGAAVALLVFGSVVVFVADHFLRPILIGGAARLPFLWVLLGIFGGLELFGLLGLFLGPTIMAVLLALWREWAKPAIPA